MPRQLRHLTCSLFAAAAILTAIRPSSAKGAVQVPIPPADQILNTLHKTHPRLLATAADFDNLKARVTTDPQLIKWHTELVKEANKTLHEAPSKYEIPDGKRLLATSRRVLHRVSLLALLYRLDGNRQYVDRAWEELDAAAHFKDWNQSHFLDTAEMTTAFAFGYDWLYDQWTDAQRAELRTAIVTHGLQPALNSYHGKEHYGWWVKAHHNWNQVCNGGIGMGALALADEIPAEAGEILHDGMVSIQLAMAKFAPDGAWPEGPGYWDYATKYNTFILAALQTALGTDFGLSKMEGFDDTGMFPIYMAAPNGRSFNFADAGYGTIRAPQLFRMAAQFHRPIYSWYEERNAAPDPFDLLWYTAPTQPDAIDAFPLDKYFRDSEVAAMRSRWDDKDALYVGVKAGDNKANHSHLDLGSFVFDALGERWAMDLGSDNYNLPAYFGHDRWTYYRLRAEGHNTLVIDPGKGPDQDPKATTKIVRFESTPARSFALVDLSDTYAAHASHVERGIVMLDRKQVLVEDEITAKQPSDVWWFLHTHAEVALADDGTTATLTIGAHHVTAHVLAPADARFTVMDAKPLPTSPDPKGQKDNHGIRKLAIHLTGVTTTRIAVALAPIGSDYPAAGTGVTVTPLAEW